MVTHDAQDIFPAAPVARQGDFLFVSTIYPLDGDGQVIRADAVSPHVGESDVAAQTRAVLNNLNDVLVNAGSSAERVVKAEVYLVDPTDFHEFKLAWKAFYPENPPARTTAVIGDDHLVSGCRLSVSAVALAGDATVDKETIHTSDAPDPMDAEWAPQAVKAAPFVFPSPFPATDFTTGVVGKTNPVAPYYGSDTELQAHYILGNWDKVLRAAGSGLDQALKAQIYGLDLANFHDLDGVWTQYVGREAGAAPPTRSAMAMRALMVPEAEYIANTVFLAPDASHEKTENRKGIRWHPEDLKNVHYSPGLSAGNWFFMAGQLAIPDYANLRYEMAPRGLPSPTAPKCAPSIPCSYSRSPRSLLARTLVISTPSSMACSSGNPTTNCKANPFGSASPLLNSQFWICSEKSPANLLVKLSAAFTRGRSPSTAPAATEATHPKKKSPYSKKWSAIRVPAPSNSK